MTVLIDSDVLIEVLRGRNAEILARWAELADSEDAVLCSPVSAAEIWRRARPKDQAAVSKLLGALVCVPIDAGTGRQAGEFLSKYHESDSVELGDALIAASVLQQGAHLWTRNRKRYPRKVRFY